MAGTTAATSGHGIGIPHGYHDEEEKYENNSDASGRNDSSQPWRPTRPYGQGTSMADSQVINVGDRLRAWTRNQAGNNAC